MSLRTIAGFGLLLVVFGCHRSAVQLPEQGVSFELQKERKRQLDSIRYGVELWIPDSLQASIRGMLKVDFLMKDESKPLVLDFSQDPNFVESVKQEGKDLRYRVENGHIIIEEGQLNKGENEVEIAFTAGDLSLNRNEEYLYTLLVPDRASTCLPLFDQPNLKARYSLTLHTPAGWEAVANEALKKRKQGNTEWTYQFEETEPISSYLLAFATGRFSKATRTLSGREMTMYYRETDSVKVARNLQEIFELHDQSLQWLEKYTGIEYPFSKFDLALIPSFQYGGMEHPGAVFYNESSLFLDENATITKKLARANVIAHESAHMWFGDLVTMDWFNDVWLKEVFANFMAAKIVHPTFPEINHQLKFLLTHFPAAYQVDRSQGANPIMQNLGNLKNAGTLYGSIIYHKAPIVMQQLEQKIGEDLMRESLREYLHQYAFGNARWDDLIGIIDKKTPLDMQAWSQVWVKTSGMPQYGLQVGDGQVHFAQVPDSVDSRIWQQPLKTNIRSLEGSKILDFDLIMGGEPVWPAKQGDLTYPNADGKAYGYFPIDTPSTQFFLNHYSEFKDPVFRGATMINIWEGFLRGQGLAPVPMAEGLLTVIAQEKDPLLIDYALGVLSTTWWNFLTEDQRLALQVKLESNLWSSMLKAEDKGLKKAFFSKYQNMAYSKDAVGKLTALWNGKLVVQDLVLSEDNLIFLACQIALLDEPRARDILKTQLAKVENADRRGKLQFMMPALDPDAAVRDAFFESLKQAKNREKEGWVLAALGYLHHPLRQQAALQYITPSMELLEEIQLTGDIFFPTRWMDHTFGGHSSKEASLLARAFLAENPNYPLFLKEKILQATDILDRSVAMRGSFAANP
ncbi:aminopeptidase N [Dyadobacter jejuensis]|uniref:Aminopeptidase N n=1 Tax=Dyadobacter jejuensis TaxID=1082580 RepID=A0A316ALM1_9BACT|nr:M1 family aminopeptidase [Dyadobacter jejuensis]PWJ58476.1 aminopeptidase N [Dyadobacter jejuensis]